MDKEFERYMEISEMFGIEMQPGMGMDGQSMDPEKESLNKKIDSLSSAVHNIRDNYMKYAEAEGDDKALYRGILQKHVELFDSLWNKVKSQVVGKSEEDKEEREPEEKTIILKTYSAGADMD